VSNVSVAANNGLLYTCVITNSAGAVTSVVATLTVVADTVAPTLASASSVGQTVIAIGFSKPVETNSATSIANYSLSGGLVASAASLADAKTVLLTVSPVIYGSNYTVTVNNVQDQASTPNTIAANSHISFTDSIELGRHFQAFLLEALRTEADNPGHEPAAGMARGGKSKRPEVPPERKVQS